MNMLVKIRQSFRVPDGFGVANQERSMRREREREREISIVSRRQRQRWPVAVALRWRAAEARWW
jgi:hypothetical protein